jgi:hypothetical protein
MALDLDHSGKRSNLTEDDGTVTIELSALL